jgi:hypothetical protein
VARRGATLLTLVTSSVATAFKKFCGVAPDAVANEKRN